MCGVVCVYPQKINAFFQSTYIVDMYICYYTTVHGLRKICNNFLLYLSHCKNSNNSIILSCRALMKDKTICKFLIIKLSNTYVHFI